MNRFKIMAAKPGTDMHTAALLHHEQGLGNPTEEHIKLAIAVWPFLFFVFCFCHSCRLSSQTRFSDSKTASIKIGNSIKLYAVSAQMPGQCSTPCHLPTPSHTIQISSMMFSRLSTLRLLIISLVTAQLKCVLSTTGNRQLN